MSDDARLEQICRRLGTDPLFAMSRASKELFHTNLLAWIAETHPDVFIAALDPWLVEDGGRTARSVRREWHHLDLVVELPGYLPLIIEAKVFALPDEDQLIRYSDDRAVRAIDPDAVCLLVTLELPDWEARPFGDDGRVWRAIRLDALSPGLLRGARGSSFDHELIRREADLLSALADLHEVGGLGSGKDRFFLDAEQRLLLAEHRLLVPVEKARASRFRSMVASRLEHVGIVTPTHELRADVSHGEALTSALWSDENGDGVGWQVQARSLTLALLNGSRSARDGYALEERFATAERNIRWFDFGPLRDRLEGPLGPERPAARFNRYDPDFVYRAVRLPDDITVDAMLDLAEIYSERATRHSFVAAG